MSPQTGLETRLAFLTHTGEQLLLLVSGNHVTCVCSGACEPCAALHVVMLAFVLCKDSLGELDCTRMPL